MNITIRNIQESDFRLVEEITREAFWNLYCPGCNEHFLVHNIRNHADFIPELSFVIELDSKVVGSILYTKSKIVSTDGTRHDVITFGPVSILPSLHRRGLGKALISHSIEEAKRLGYRAIVIGGYPYHYEIYGFTGSKKYHITMPDGKYYTGIMALPLHDGALDGISGYIQFTEAFEADEADVANFDAHFPPKEKSVKESQHEFGKASVEIDTRVFEKQ
ncbi:MAG: N-acetyltransferase [Tannerella sp.]|jgi:predicted N-acetyltransferase YhbS|nr:N-acetyltransferase [Tannerella sp.]